MCIKARFCWLFTVLILPTGFAQSQAQKSTPDQSPFSCSPVRIPTSWAFDNPPGRIEDHSASFTPIGWDTIQLKFRNDQPTPVQALKLVVEYMDAQGEPLARVPMYATVNPAVAHVPANVLKPANTWGAPVKTGESGEMVGEEASLRTGHCPVRAQVTFASIQFDDGTGRTYSSPNWRLEPTPALVPVLRNLPTLPVEPPVSLFAKVRISASGDILDLVPDANGDARLVGWLRDVMGKDWKFHPAILNGQPIESELNVLFQINAKGMTEFVENLPILKPVTLIRFVWTRDVSSSDAGEKLMAMYGVLTEGSSPAASFQPPN
jgi:hypothetical protein